MRLTLTLLALLAPVLLVGCGDQATNTSAPRSPNTTTPANTSAPAPSGANPDTSAAAIPAFPWPPPRASARHVVPWKFLRNPEGPTLLRDVSARLEQAFDSAGYSDRSWYSVPNGFALVSQLEQFRADGTPLDGPARWAVKVTPGPILNFSDYVRALFTAPRGHYRVIAFVVTDQPFTQARRELNREEAEELIRGGVDRLPSFIGEREYTQDFNCTAMIYEYEQTSSGRPARFRLPSALTGRTHLEMARLRAALER